MAEATTTAVTLAPGAAPPAPAPKLDELMLAMDVVDTLRHQEQMVEKEFGQDLRDDQLKARLRQIYEGQGLAVSDRILDEGIRALKESRFTYTPRGTGFGRTLARMWVNRGKVAAGSALLLALGAGGVGYVGWQQTAALREADRAQVELTQTLPRELSAAAEAALREARQPKAREAADRLVADGEAALGRKDAGAVRAAVAGLTALRGELVREFQFRIVNRPGENSGVFRVPDVNRGSRNFYLIVEPVTPAGEVVSVPILSEETNRTETVSKFGVRVPQSTYDLIVADKRDDGIIQRNRLGDKRRGDLDPSWNLPVQGGYITKW